MRAAAAFLSTLSSVACLVGAPSLPDGAECALVSETLVCDWPVPRSVVSSAKSRLREFRREFDVPDADLWVSSVPVLAGVPADPRNRIAGLYSETGFIRVLDRGAPWEGVADCYEAVVVHELWHATLHGGGLEYPGTNSHSHPSWLLGLRPTTDALWASCAREVGRRRTGTKPVAPDRYRKLEGEIDILREVSEFQREGRLFRDKVVP